LPFSVGNVKFYQMDSQSCGAKGLKMLSNLFGGGTSVGLSIGTSSIKIVEVKKSRGSWQLLHFGIIQLPDDTIVNREIVNPISVVESIRTLVNEIRLSTKAVTLSLSGTALIVKRMNIEIQNPGELQDQVFWEAEQYLPFDISEVVLDYELVSKTKDNLADVVLVAVKKVAIESYMNCVADAGLSPKVVDADFFALQNLFEIGYPTKSGEAVAIVDIGAAGTKIIILHNHVPAFTKDVALGGKNITVEIQKHLNLSFQDAEALKVGRNEMPQEVKDVMTAFCNSFATEIKRGIDYYNASSGGAPVSYVLLTGGSSRIVDLLKIVESAVGISTQLMNPFGAVSYDPVVFTDDYVASISPIASIPLGLAIRSASK